MTDDADKFPFMDFDIRIVKSGLLERRPDAVGIGHIA